MKFKKIAGVGLAIAMMAPIGVLAAQPAGAAAVLTCAKPSGFVTFTPGLGTTPKIQTTNFTLPVTGCKGTPGVTSGSSKGSSKGTKPQSCGTFASAGKTTTTVTITWNNKKTSTASLATTIVPGAKGVITATVSGKVSKGLFVGKTVKTKVQVKLVSGACTDKSPLKKASLTGLAPLTIG
jgi:hypothetical protein